MNQFSHLADSVVSVRRKGPSPFIIFKISIISVTLILLSGFLLMARQPEPAPATADHPPASGASQEENVPDAPSSNRNKMVERQFSREKTHLTNLNVNQFIAQHQRTYPILPQVELSQVAYHKETSAAFSLDILMNRQLSAMGFAVAPANTEPTFFGKGHSAIYYEIYEADLPVFITVDSMLHAFHRTFDDIMQSTEEYILYPRLYDLLAQLLGQLDPSISEQRDLMVYLAVPYLLLENGIRFLRDDESTVLLPTIPEDILAAAKVYVEWIYNESAQQFVFFGTPMALDFSIFYPRGHYGKSFELQSYFRAMTWLIQMPLTAYQSDLTPQADRHERMTHVLLNKMSRSSQWHQFVQINQFYKRLIGNDNSAGPDTVRKQCRQKGWKECPDDHVAMRKLLRQVARSQSSDNGHQTDALYLKFFPSKFGYTAWVTEQTTQPQLNPKTPMRGRTMASPFDVAYALGSDRAITYLKADLLRDDGDQLAKALTSARHTMGKVSPTRIAATPYSDWLEALMHASAPVSGAHIPTVLQTAPWHDHKIETVLASWTEMRHDTLLMIQSFGGVGCDFPLAYVEPVLGVYRSLSAAAAKMQQLYEPFSHDALKDTNDFFEHFQRTMKRLELISAAELQGRSLSDSDLKFINGMMKMEMDNYTGERLYNGWYPRLYWTPFFDRDDYTPQSGTDEPLVADVYEDIQNQQVLEAATGHPGILFIVIKTQGKQVLYAGPVSEFHYFTRPSEDRLNDDDWRQILADDPPAHPDFARAYWMN